MSFLSFPLSSSFTPHHVSFFTHLSLSSIHPWRLLKVKPEERLTIEGVLAHPWLNCTEALDNVLPSAQMMMDKVSGKFKGLTVVLKKKKKSPHTSQCLELVRKTGRLTGSVLASSHVSRRWLQESSRPMRSSWPTWEFRIWTSAWSLLTLSTTRSSGSGNCWGETALVDFFFSFSFFHLVVFWNNDALNEIPL